MIILINFENRLHYNAMRNKKSQIDKKQIGKNNNDINNNNLKFILNRI
jgi:hypothetical protein